MAIFTHELWIDPEGLETFCFASPRGDEIRKLLPSGSKLVWTVDAGSHFEAMTKYYAYLDRGPYLGDQVWHFEPYPDDWQ